MRQIAQFAMYLHEVRAATVQQERIVEKQHTCARTNGASLNALVDSILVPIEDVEDYRGR